MPKMDCQNCHADEEFFEALERGETPYAVRHLRHTSSAVSTEEQPICPRIKALLEFVLVIAIEDREAMLFMAASTLHPFDTANQLASRIGPALNHKRSRALSPDTIAAYARAWRNQSRGNLQKLAKIFSQKGKNQE
ncbi:MAG: hypothetical protein AB7F32_05045 [Victivallaceae bacterium]